MTDTDHEDRCELSLPRATVGVIADTHAEGDLAADPPEVLLEELRESDLILHAGDIGSPELIAALEKIAPVVAVRGNSAGDPTGPLGGLPRCLQMEIAGRAIVLVHGDRGASERAAPRRDNALWRAVTQPLDHAALRRAFNYLLLARLFARFRGRADCVVFGHTHIPTRARLGGILFLNPGDAQYTRRGRIHIAKLQIEPGRAPQAELLTIDLPTREPAPSSSRS